MRDLETKAKRFEKRVDRLEQRWEETREQLLWTALVCLSLATVGGIKLYFSILNHLQP